MASMLRAVSFRVSPLVVLLEEEEKLITSAERYLPASSKLVLVRVLGSKKRLATTLPLRVGTFLMSLSRISFMESADSKM